MCFVCCVGTWEEESSKCKKEFLLLLELINMFLTFAVFLLFFYLFFFTHTHELHCKVVLLQKTSQLWVPPMLVCACMPIIILTIQTVGHVCIYDEFGTSGVYQRNPLEMGFF